MITEPASGLPRQATITDVARVAGTSTSTASRALTGTGYVGTEVRARVQDAALTLGYVPDLTARHLKQKTGRSIGVVVSDLRNPFYSDLAAGIAERAREHGYTMVLADNRMPSDDEDAAAARMASLRVAGVIVTPVSRRLPEYLAGRGTPVIEVDRQFAADRCDAVVIDNVHATRLVMDELISLGHRRIALFIDETEWTTGRDRYAEYGRALGRAGIPLDPHLVVSAGWSAEAARTAAVDLLRSPVRATAVFCANNVLAEGAWRAIAELGLAVPGDISVISFDDAPWMSMVTPGVTAIAQRADRLGAAAVDRLLERIADPAAPPSVLTLPAELVRRDSTSHPH